MGEEDRPPDDAGQLRAIADWLDIADGLLSTLFRNEELFTLGDEDRAMIVGFLDGAAMQKDLRRIAARLDAADKARGAKDA